MSEEVLHLRSLGTKMDQYSSWTLCDKWVPLKEVVQAGDYLGLLRMNKEMVLGPICPTCLIIELKAFAMNVADGHDPWDEETADFILIRRYIRKNEARGFA